MSSGGDVERKAAEARHFDDWESARGREVVFYDTPFLSQLLTDLESRAKEAIGDVEGKRILIYGCGANIKLAREFGERGAFVDLIDISPVSVECVNKRINELSLNDVLSGHVMDCEAMEFDDGTFDVVFGRAILHHLDLRRAAAEIRRVLKEKGIGVFIEPLGMNPVINLYRRLTPNRRTKEEAPLTSDDLSLLRGFGFSGLSSREFTLTANVGLFANSILKLPAWLSPSYECYRRIDDVLLGMFPFLGRYCWNAIVTVTK
jgi:SAM-dependent methyltransferase